MNWAKHAPGSPTSLGEPPTSSGSPAPTAWHTSPSTNCSSSATTYHYAWYKTENNSGTNEQLPHTVADRTDLSLGSQSAKLSTRHQARWLSSPTAAPRWSHLVRTCQHKPQGTPERAAETLQFYAGYLPQSSLSLTTGKSDRAHCP